MLFNIAMGILLVIQYALVVYAGYNRANDKLHKDELHVAIWETLERVCLATFCIEFFIFWKMTEFDMMTLYLKEILEKLEALTAHG